MGQVQVTNIAWMFDQLRERLDPQESYDVDGILRDYARALEHASDGLVTILPSGEVLAEDGDQVERARALAWPRPNGRGIAVSRIIERYRRKGARPQRPEPMSRNRVLRDGRSAGGRP